MKKKSKLVYFVAFSLGCSFQKKRCYGLGPSCAPPHCQRTCRLNFRVLDFIFLCPPWCGGCDSKNIKKQDPGNSTDKSPSNGAVHTRGQGRSRGVLERIAALFSPLRRGGFLQVVVRCGAPSDGQAATLRHAELVRDCGPELSCRKAK